MHITCPHCNAAYEVGPVIKNALLVCYRCHTEFGVDETLVKAKNETPATAEQEGLLPLFEHTETGHPKSLKRGNLPKSNSMKNLLRSRDRQRTQKQRKKKLKLRQKMTKLLFPLHENVRQSSHG